MKLQRSRKFATVIPGTLALLAAAMSAANEENANEENTIPFEYRYAAINAGVPYKLLYAIAIAESDNPRDPNIAPWPWVLNIGGEPHWFETRQEAQTALASALAAGRTNIDICASQVNFRYNGHLMPDLANAFDTESCLLAASAVLLRELDYCEHQLDTLDWWCAVERYHSPGQSEAQRERAVAYADRVRQIYARLTP
ncbi:MAG: hypothetical protein CSB44_01970 [Gammaproteobacteria bacterium]|nr:MAG: hypothetical protein CSB44_01970 [Gammaproteobacteria bacterium]